MKAHILIPFVLSVSVSYADVRFTAPAIPPVSDDVLLSAIAEVETGNNAARLGRNGERSHLQILPATWRRFSDLPHSVAATNSAETERVARAYLSHIRTRMRSRHLPETPFFLAAAWNAGPGWSRLPSRTVAYAERVANLVAAAHPERAEPRPVVSRESIVSPLSGSGTTGRSVPVILLADSN